MAQDKVIIRRSGHQQLDELDATDIPALAYDASGAAADAQSAASTDATTKANAAQAAAIASAATDATTKANAAAAASQPLDADLTAIAALSTTTIGRSLLAGADAAALRTILALGTAATHATGDYEVAGAAAAAQAASQPLDSDLTAIAALSTTSYGRALLALADAAALRTAAGLGSAALLPNPYLPYRTGGTFYYSSWTGGVSLLALVQSTLYAVPFYVPVTTTFTKIAVVSGVVASATARLGIYSDTGGVPNALVLDAGSVTIATATIHEIAISQSLTAGWYWLAVAPQAAAGSVYCNVSGFFANAALPVVTPAASFISGGYSQTGITGTLPSPWGATKTETARCPVVFMVVQ